jgi:hypothetical protein
MQDQTNLSHNFKGKKNPDCQDKNCGKFAFCHEIFGQINGHLSFWFPNRDAASGAGQTLLCPSIYAFTVVEWWH